MKNYTLKFNFNKFVVPFIISMILVLNQVYSQEPLILGIHPFLPHSELKQQFAPLAEYLSKELEQDVIIKIGTNYDDHISNIGKNKIDITFLGPAIYVEVVKKYNKKPILAIIENNNTKYFQGKIIVREESSIKTISEINIENFAFVSPMSTMGYILPIYMLYNVGNVNVSSNKYSFLGSHQNVALGVLCGDFDAGAVKEEVYNSYCKKGLRVLASTPKIPNHLFIANSILSTEKIKKIQQALFKLNDSENGKLIMESISKSITNMTVVEDSFYNELRDIIYFLENAGLKDKQK